MDATRYRGVARFSSQSAAARLRKLLGFVRFHVDCLEALAGDGDQLADPQVRICQEPVAVLEQRRAPLVEGEGTLERLAAGLELRDGPLELGEGLVEAQLVDCGIG